MTESKCGRKTALSVFFSVSLAAFLFSLISLLSPSWQYANLENGRTEHHHGLWLDCKRDYSFDYGRTREYYETLYRRDMQGSPFEMFFLPPLQCVYKFDYYIDPEDLYDHNHDENRLQNDAYQHLFLGWKVAALAAIGVAVCFSAASSLLGICSFCHRTFICASTVLVTISAILSSVGIIVFYMWANYQDNKVIKEEEDTIYEQTLGWAFHFQIIGAALHWLSSVLGCCVTSVSLGKNRGAKLVKIEVMEGDESMLLQSNSSIQQPFKRSFSAIYRVDSQSLRQFEREYLRNAQSTMQNSEMSTFKRTASVPNFTKKQRKDDKQKQRQLNRSNMDLFTSNSNITESTRTGSIVTLDTQRTKEISACGSAHMDLPPVPLPSVKPLKSALKTPQSTRKAYDDSTYEYLPCPGSMAVSSYSNNSRPVYDDVYEEIGPELYLEPNSVRARSQNSSVNFEAEKKKAMTPPPTQSMPFSNTNTISSFPTPTKPVDVRSDSAVSPSKMPKPILKAMLPPPINPPMTIRDFGMDLTKEPKGYYTEISHKVYGSDIRYTRSKSDFHSNGDIENRLRKLSGRSSFAEASAPPAVTQTSTSLTTPSITSTTITKQSSDIPGVSINTFANREGQRSITNLTYIAKDKTAADLFDRPESVEPTPTSYEKKKIPSLQRSLFRNIVEEVDRSVGSSTILENDTMSETGSYIRDAEIRLNLFLNDSTKPQQQDETTV